MHINNISFEYLKKKFEVDLKWNSLIFELYKNKVVLNMNEVEEKINSEIQKSDSSKSFLLSEIQVNLPEGDPQVVVKKIMDNIKMEGFEILGVSVSDNYKQLKKFSNKIEVDYKLLFGSSDEMAIVIQNYGGFYSVPVSYLINREGFVVRGYPGAILGEYWTNLLNDDLLKFLAYSIIIEETDKANFFQKQAYELLKKKANIKDLSLPSKIIIFS